MFCPNNALQHVYGQGEDDRGVLLGSDGGQRLKVPQLKGCRRLGDDHGGLFQGPGCVHFSLGCNDLWHGRREQSKWRKRQLSTSSLQTQVRTLNLPGPSQNILRKQFPVTQFPYVLFLISDLPAYVPEIKTPSFTVTFGARFRGPEKGTIRNTV